MSAIPTDPSRISHVRCISAAGAAAVMTREDVIALIERGWHVSTMFTGSDGVARAGSRVRVVHATTGNFLRTDADATAADNLQLAPLLATPIGLAHGGRASDQRRVLSTTGDAGALATSVHASGGPAGGELSANGQPLPQDPMPLRSLRSLFRAASRSTAPVPSPGSSGRPRRTGAGSREIPSPHAAR